MPQRLYFKLFLLYLHPPTHRLILHQVANLPLRLLLLWLLPGFLSQHHLPLGFVLPALHQQLSHLHLSHRLFDLRVALLFAGGRQLSGQLSRWQLSERKGLSELSCGMREVCV